MSGSVKRVEAAAKAAGLDVAIQKMPESTRTAMDAAQACGCDVGQIVKSMIFEGADSGTLKLLLVSGRHDVDLARMENLFGETLIRADAKRVRAETGFAIGGVAPIGHKSAIAVWIDAELMKYEAVWAAAGAPDAVFNIAPADLKSVTDATVFDLGQGAMD